MRPMSKKFNRLKTRTISWRKRVIRFLKDKERLQRTPTEETAKQITVLPLDKKPTVEIMVNRTEVPRKQQEILNTTREKVQCQSIEMTLFRYN